ncbi:E3 ubiquitin-protein ligase Topors [Spea bombifrons]|uniref:E3 ubiquitin-protein ligase Topors n=1 Tax=Spea bombifrons TaxID=233779 RepID=UPI00234B8CFB|nr:E3 ubiquitin-protein ligase Topors [Spea bombifrons]
MRERRSRRRKAGGGSEEAADPMMASTTEDTSKLQGHGAPADASPDSKCPICLDRFDNVSHLDRCLHRFCFRCIQEWAKNKTECPLCKQPFYSIFHSIRAEDDFKEYVLRPTMNGSFGSPDGRRFRYRTTLTRDYRLPVRSLRSSSSQRTFSPPDHGILFEGISNQTSRQMGGEIRQMMRRLASRRQASAEGRSMRQIQEQELINFRRALYRSGMRVRNIQDGGRYRDISAGFFQRNPACLHRLIPWLKRELTVLFGTHGSLANIVQHIIMSNMTRYDMESQAFVEDLRPFLLHRTDHFLHEFINFARCPYNIEAYDQHANYDCPAPSYEEGSHSESSVITISPDEAHAREPDVSEPFLSVGQTPWDDETPGPSYSTLEQPTATTSTTVDISESSDEEPLGSRLVAQDSKHGSPENTRNSLNSDDCVIVGYVKPLSERTPELVELSSDSEGSLCEVNYEDTKKPLLKPFTLSDSNASSGSSSPIPSLTCHNAHKAALKASISPKKNTISPKKDKGKKPLGVSSRITLESRKDNSRSCSSHSVSEWRSRSRSSDCYSRSSHNRGHSTKRQHHAKTRVRTKTPEKSRHKGRREKKKSRSRDRSLSLRSRTVSLTSESSRERAGSSSRSKNRCKGRSRSRDGDFTREKYHNKYQWEYTYYSRNRVGDGYEQSYRRRTCVRGHYSRNSSSPEYKVPSSSERRGVSRERRHVTGRQHHRERYRSRSCSSSQINTSSTERNLSEKPGGKRKYKTRHLENKENDDGARAAQPRSTEQYRDELPASSSKEPKKKWKKKTRSPSVEIVYEGKTAESTRHHKKKKKKKHKKKRRREQSSRSPATSPVIITIDSGSETPIVDDPLCNDNSTPSQDESNNATSIAAPSQTTSTSAMASTTDISAPDISTAEEAEPYSKGYGLCSSSGNLVDPTGILDGLLLGEKPVEQHLPAKCTSPSRQTHHVENPITTELSPSDPEAAQDTAAPLTGPTRSELQQDLAEETYASPLLEQMTAGETEA